MDLAAQKSRPIDSAAQLLLGGAVVFTAWTFFDNYSLKQERLVLITDRSDSVSEIDDEWGQLRTLSQTEAAECLKTVAYCDPADPATQPCSPPKQYKVHEQLFYNHKTWSKILNLPYFLDGCIANGHCDQSMTLDFFCPGIIKLDVLLTAHNKFFDVIIKHVINSKGSSENFKGFTKDPSLIEMAEEETPRNLAEMLKICRSQPRFSDYQQAYRRYYETISTIVEKCPKQ